jgi:Fic family protein
MADKDADIEADIHPAVDRGETLSSMEPLLLSDNSRHRKTLSDLALELAIASAGFRRSLPPGIMARLADLVRAMNCYYSNLIEGNATHPVDIEKALAGEYSHDPKKRDLQYEAKAHITVQRWIDDGHLGGRATTAAGVCELHQRFSELLPDELLIASDPLTGRTVKVEPGELRRDDVKVGQHIPVSAGAVPRFLDRFEKTFSALGKSEAILAAAAAHHRLLWIHPFMDGNGRVARLMSHAVLLDTLDTGAVWSVARGLARNVGQYKQHLASCDGPRRNDLDGRGNLSEEALAAFTDFFLKTCLDQVRFMEALVQPERLRGRIMAWAEEETKSGALPPKSAQVLEAVLFRGELPRGDVAPLLGVTDRHARRIVSALLDRGVLVSEGPRDPLFISFPAALASRWMPGLFPDLPGDQPVPMTAPIPAPILRTELMRVFELKDTLSDPANPDAYFQNFEKSLQENSQKLDAFRKVEAVLSVLDADSWSTLKHTASGHLVKPSPNKGRGWQSLFDVLSEARGYSYLRSVGCTDIRFVGRTEHSTPDIEAQREGRRVVCEVKTINISDDEAGRRRRVHSGTPVASKVPTELGAQYLGKLNRTLANAVRQLDAADPQREAQRIVFCVLNFDDWVGDYYPAYFREIDAHLLGHPVEGAELVFFLPNNLFGRSFEMRTATVATD